MTDRVSVTMLNLTQTTTLHTVTPGKVFRLYSLVGSVTNSSTSAAGQWQLWDDTGARLSFHLPAGTVGQPLPQHGVTHNWPVPVLSFTGKVEYRVIAGSPAASLTIVGIEE